MAKITKSGMTETPTTDVTTVQNVTIPQATFNSLMSRIEELEKGQSEIKENKFEKAKEHYEGPLQAKYRLWAGVPVLSAKTVKKDPAFDLYYKNPAGVYVDNHYLELTLSDGTVLDGKNKILNSSFANFYERSELTPFGVILKDGTEISSVNNKKLVAMRDEVESVIFDTKQFGRLIVDRDFIN